MNHVLAFMRAACFFFLFRMKSHEQFRLTSAVALAALGIGLSIHGGSIVPLIVAVVAWFLLWV